MDGLKFNIEPKLNIKKIKKIILKFKKNKNYNEKNVKWDYFSNPFGKSKFFVAKYNNLIIGLIVCFKQVFINNTGKFNGYRIQDVITDTSVIKYLIKNKKKLLTENNKGIFENLILKLNKFLIKKSEINLGFANHLAFPYWKRNNWKELSNFPLYEKNLKFIDNFNLEYKEIKKFNKKHEKIFLENLDKKIDIYWSSKYLNWRYVKNPRSNYFNYEFFYKKKLIGYIVLKEYLSDQKKIGHICQIIAEKKFKEEIIRFANNFFVKKKIFKLSLWSNDSSLMKKTKFNKNFPIDKKIVYFGLINFKKLKLHINMGFSDIY